MWPHVQHRQRHQRKANIWASPGGCGILFPWLSFMFTWSWRSLCGAGWAVAEGGWWFKFASHSSDEDPPTVLHSGIKVPLNSFWSPACSAGMHLLPLTFGLQHVCSSALKVWSRQGSNSHTELQIHGGATEQSSLDSRFCFKNGLPGSGSLLSHKLTGEIRGQCFLKLSPLSIIK